MRLLADLSTRAKLLLGFGAIIALMALISAMAYRDNVALQASQRELYKDDLAIVLNVTSLRNAINRERVALFSLLVVDAAEMPGVRKRLDEEIVAVNTLLDKLLQFSNADGVFSADRERLIKAHEQYVGVRDGQVLAVLQTGKRGDAGRILTGALQQKFDTLKEVGDQMGTRQLAQAEERMRDTEALVEHGRMSLIITNMAALLVALALVVWLDRVIATPLKLATVMAGKIAAGDLRVEIVGVAAQDEVGQLMRALAKMVDAWREVMAETNRGIVTLSAASNEILASTVQGAAGAAETAAAVSETTATVEEVKQTALLASQKSRMVSDAAQHAAKTADDGRKSIDDSVEGMHSIREKMEAIAATIVRLSERSHAVAEITVTVSGLAEQSNLLAVNAAIEAAKAGEHGRGFAVVAQEVKNLAEQSKQATRQVREILGEIQKGIGAAVMITEQGAKTVAAGVEQTNSAGEAIRALAESIADAAQAAAQIAASSQQQLAGMDQVALAMVNINQVSAENAAGSRQAEVAAHSLHALSQSLQQSSQKFRL